jgi:hypothetical protein
MRTTPWGRIKIIISDFLYICLSVEQTTVLVHVKDIHHLSCNPDKRPIVLLNTSVHNISSEIRVAPIVDANYF